MKASDTRDEIAAQPEGPTVTDRVTALETAQREITQYLRWMFPQHATPGLAEPAPADPPADPSA